MEMAENGTTVGNRERQLARLRERYPDKSFEDDESIYGQIGEDYDTYERELEDYRGREKALADMLATDPRSADILVGIHRGEDPVVGLVRNYGIEIKDVLDNPEMQDKIAEAQKDYVERVSRDKQLEEEYDKNMQATYETLRRYQESRGLSDDEIDRLVDFLLGVIRDGIMGKFSEETLDMASKALSYDSDIAVASEEGRITGRNEKITEKLRKANEGDGMAMLGGKNGNGVGGKRQQNMFDLANEAM
ncbi:MAG: hypothetical protein ACI30K_00935 [Muribaculaceae bacterium]